MAALFVVVDGVVAIVSGEVFRDYRNCLQAID